MDRRSTCRYFRASFFEGTLAGMMLLALPCINIISAKLGVIGFLGVAIAIALTLDLSINIRFDPTW